MEYKTTPDARDSAAVKALLALADDLSDFSGPALGIF